MYNTDIMKEHDKENVKIGSLLRDARKSRGVMQSELVELTGLTQNHISAVERGVSKASIRMLLGYCEKLRLTPNDILGFGDGKINPNLKSILEELSDDEQVKILEMLMALRK